MVLIDIIYLYFKVGVCAHFSQVKCIHAVRLTGERENDGDDNNDDNDSDNDNKNNFNDIFNTRGGGRTVTEGRELKVNVRGNVEPIST